MFPSVWAVFSVIHSYTVLPLCMYIEYQLVHGMNDWLGTVVVCDVYNNKHYSYTHGHSLRPSASTPIPVFGPSSLV